MSPRQAQATDLPAPNRRLGILLGQAVGDALGAGTEFQTPDQIAFKHGEVRGYVKGVMGFEPGEFTDDTQMVLCVLAAYWDARRGDDLLDAALKRFREWLDSGPPDVGITTSGALRAARRGGRSGGFEVWKESGYQAAGNGALMRAAASAVAGRRGDALRTEAIGLAALTHPDPRSLGACLALVVALEALLDGAEPSDAWSAAVEELGRFPIVETVEAGFGADRAAELAPRLAEGVAGVRAAIEAGLRGEYAGQSGYVLETLQVAVTASTAASLLDGIVPIVNRGDDSDTAAAVAGAVLGARGLAPPEELVAGLQCRHRWPSWPWGDRPAAPALAAFVPSADVEHLDLDEPDAEMLAAYHTFSWIPGFEYDTVAERVLAGRNPLYAGEVRKLAAAGVTHVLDLREAREWSGPGRRGRGAMEEIGRLGLTYQCVTITDQGRPTPPAFDRSAAFLDAALSLGATVYVHCRAGMERTAAILAAWYARAEGVSVDNALAALQRRRPAFRPLPHQLEAARDWARRA